MQIFAAIPVVFLTALASSAAINETASATTSLAPTVTAVVLSTVILNPYAPPFKTLTIIGDNPTATTFKIDCTAFTPHSVPAPPSITRSYKSECLPQTLTQGSSTWEFYFDRGNQGTVSMNCKFGSGGLVSGIATCTSTVKGLIAHLFKTSSEIFTAAATDVGSGAFNTVALVRLASTSQDTPSSQDTTSSQATASSQVTVSPQPTTTSHATSIAAPSTSVLPGHAPKASGVERVAGALGAVAVAVGLMA